MAILSARRRLTRTGQSQPTETDYITHCIRHPQSYPEMYIVQHNRAGHIVTIAVASTLPLALRNKFIRTPKQDGIGRCARYNRSHPHQNRINLIRKPTGRHPPAKVCLRQGRATSLNAYAKRFSCSDSIACSSGIGCTPAACCTAFRYACIKFEGPSQPDAQVARW